MESAWLVQLGVLGLATVSYAPALSGSGYATISATTPVTTTGCSSPCDAGGAGGGSTAVCVGHNTPNVPFCDYPNGFLLAVAAGGGGGGGQLGKAAGAGAAAGAGPVCHGASPSTTCVTNSNYYEQDGAAGAAGGNGKGGGLGSNTCSPTCALGGAGSTGGTGGNGSAFGPNGSNIGGNGGAGGSVASGATCHASGGGGGGAGWYGGGGGGADSACSTNSGGGGGSGSSFANESTPSLVGAGQPLPTITAVAGSPAANCGVQSTECATSATPGVGGAAPAIGSNTAHTGGQGSVTTSPALTWSSTPNCDGWVSATVPAGVSSLQFTLLGGGGGSGAQNGAVAGSAGGNGAQVVMTFTGAAVVTAGQTIWARIGCGGGANTSTVSNGGSGYSTGGNGGTQALTMTTVTLPTTVGYCVIDAANGNTSVTPLTVGVAPLNSLGPVQFTLVGASGASAYPWAGSGGVGETVQLKLNLGDLKPLTSPQVYKFLLVDGCNGNGSLGGPGIATGGSSNTTSPPPCNATGTYPACTLVTTNPPGPVTNPPGPWATANGQGGGGGAPTGICFEPPGGAATCTASTPLCPADWASSAATCVLAVAGGGGGNGAAQVVSTATVAACTVSAGIAGGGGNPYGSGLMTLDPRPGNPNGATTPPVNNGGGVIGSIPTNTLTADAIGPTYGIPAVVAGGGGGGGYNDGGPGTSAGCGGGEGSSWWVENQSHGTTGQVLNTVANPQPGVTVTPIGSNMLAQRTEQVNGTTW